MIGAMLTSQMGLGLEGSTETEENEYLSLLVSSESESEGEDAGAESEEEENEFQVISPTLQKVPSRRSGFGDVCESEMDRAVQRQDALEKSTAFMMKSASFHQQLDVLAEELSGDESEEEMYTEVRPEMVDSIDAEEMVFLGKDKLCDKMKGDFSSTQDEFAFLRMMVMTHCYIMDTVEFVRVLVGMYHEDGASDAVKCRVLRCFLLLADLTADFEAEKNRTWIAECFKFVAEVMDKHVMFADEFLLRARTITLKLLGLKKLDPEVPYAVHLARRIIIQKNFAMEWRVEDKDLIGTPAEPKPVDPEIVASAEKFKIVSKGLLDAQTAAALHQRAKEVITRLDFFTPDFLHHYILTAVAKYNEKSRHPHYFWACKAVDKAHKDLKVSKEKIVEAANVLLKKGVIQACRSGVKSFADEETKFFFPRVKGHVYADNLKPEGGGVVTTFLKIPPGEMAHQLTLIAYNYISKVTFKDICFTKSGNPSEKNAFEKLTRFGISVSRWVTMEIMLVNDGQAATEAINYFVSVMQILRNDNKFCAMAIAEGLNHKSIRRISRLWSFVDKETIRLIKDVAREAQDSVDYRMFMNSAYNVIPYFPKVWKDVEEIQSGYVLQKDGNYNILALDMYTLILNAVYSLRHTLVHFKINPPVSKFILESVDKAYTEKKLMEKSRLLRTDNVPDRMAFSAEIADPTAPDVFAQQQDASRLGNLGLVPRPDRLFSHAPTKGTPELEDQKKEDEPASEDDGVFKSADKIFDDIFVPFSSLSSCSKYVEMVVYTHHHFMTTKDFVTKLLDAYDNPGKYIDINESEVRARVLRCFLTLSGLVHDFPGDYSEWFVPILVFIVGKCIGTHDFFVDQFMHRAYLSVLEVCGSRGSAVAIPPGIALANSCIDIKAATSEWKMSDKEVLAGDGHKVVPTPAQIKRMEEFCKLVKRGVLDVNQAATLVNLAEEACTKMFLDNKDLLCFFWKSSDITQNDLSGVNRRYHAFTGSKGMKLALNEMSAAQIPREEAKTKITLMANELLTDGILKCDVNGRPNFIPDDNEYYFTSMGRPFFPDNTRDPSIEFYSYLDLSPHDLAAQITLITQDLFSEITLREISFGAHAKSKEDPDSVPNVAKFNEFPDKLTRWVQTEILLATRSEKRIKKIVTYFYNLANELMKIDNILCATCIAGGLCAVPVERLPVVKESLRKEEWDEMNKVQFLLSRKVDVNPIIANSHITPSIPVIPQLWNDLITTDANNGKDRTNDDTGVKEYNMAIVEKTYLIFKAVKAIARMVFPFKFDAPVNKYVSQMINAFDDAEITRRSYLYLPRGGPNTPSSRRSNRFSFLGGK